MDEIKSPANANTARVPCCIFTSCVAGILENNYDFRLWEFLAGEVTYFLNRLVSLSSSSLLESLSSFKLSSECSVLFCLRN